jgi:hypothetical protein
VLRPAAPPPPLDKAFAAIAQEVRDEERTDKDWSLTELDENARLWVAKIRSLMDTTGIKVTQHWRGGAGLHWYGQSQHQSSRF